MPIADASIADFSQDSVNYLKYFADHLVQFNTQSPVVFKEPVIIDGKVVVTEGDRFDENTIQLLLAGDTPIDYLDSISLTRPMDGKALYFGFTALRDNDKAIAGFAELHSDFSELKKCCEHLACMEGVMLQLTVLKHQLPLVYEQALFCAWLGVSLMRQLKRNSSDIFNVFMLAMIHDVGLLHVPKEFVKSRKHFTCRQLRMLQAHSAVGFYMLKRVSRIPDDVLRAVAEHHECLDGTGYPAGKVGNTISRLGQMLNFLDAVNAIYTKRLKPGERPLRDLIPMIQMNGHSRFGVLGKKLIEWLKELPEPKARAVPNVLMPFLITAVRDRNTYISACLDVIDKLAKDIGFRHGDQRVFALQNAIIHINISITQSGIINAAYMRWLDQVEAEGLAHAYREVEDVYLMMQEVIYHIGKLKTQIEFFLSTPCDSAEAFKLKKGLERLERVMMPKVHPNLEILWIANVH